MSGRQRCDGAKRVEVLLVKAIVSSRFKTEWHSEKTYPVKSTTTRNSMNVFDSHACRKRCGRSCQPREAVGLHSTDVGGMR